MVGFHHSVVRGNEGRNEMDRPLQSWPVESVIDFFEEKMQPGLGEMDKLSKVSEMIRG